MIRLALFDLDHTLLPFDSGMHWMRFLIARGVLPEAFADGYLARCRDYLAGTLDIAALHRYAMGALVFDDPRATRHWQECFGVEARAAVSAEACALVARHRDAGDLCCIVTTTNEVVAAPFAAAFGIPHLLATRAEMRHGVFTGAMRGAPCHGEEKVRRVEAWLAEQGISRTQLAGSVFYSDSASDLPLLRHVDEAVAVNPDPALRAHAQAHGWRILDALADGTRSHPTA